MNSHDVSHQLDYVAGKVEHLISEVQRLHERLDALEAEKEVEEDEQVAIIKEFTTTHFLT